MEIKLICNYCDKRWVMQVWTTKTLKVRCPDCNDRNIKIIEESETGNGTDVYGYNYKPKHLESEDENE